MAEHAEVYLEKRPEVNATIADWWLVNIVSGNGLVPSGNKPLPVPMLTQIYVAISCYLATMSSNQFTVQWLNILQQNCSLSLSNGKKYGNVLLRTNKLYFLNTPVINHA